MLGAAYLLGAAAQYFDGYQTVIDATTPVQIRLAYQGPTAMEGEFSFRNASVGLY